MRTISKHILWIILFSFCVNLGFNTCICASVEAAGMTQQEKAKEQAAKQKAKEQAAKQKAKEQAAKQKAKEQAAKQKAKEQAAKQKAKEQAATQKAKEQAAKQKAKEQPVKEQTVKISREEEYAKKVAEIEKYNAYVSKYMSRDITHRVGAWGQIGYSNLLPQGINYNSNDLTGFDVKSKGGVGGGFGAGYQMRYARLLVTTGLELQFYSSLWQLSTSDLGMINRTFGMQPYADKLLYSYSFANSQDKLLAGYVQIPVLAGMEFAQRRAYFLAGPKLGLAVMGQSQVSGMLSTQINDLEGIDPYQEISSHALVKDKAYTASFAPAWGVNLSLYGEIGMSLDPWIKIDKICTRLAAFVEYGVVNIQSTKNTIGANDQPVDYTRVLNTEHPGHPVNDVAMVSSLTTTTATSAKVNPLLVGVKATCWFNIPRKELRQKPIPKAPLPTMYAQVVSTVDHKPLAGAMVAISSPNNELTSKTANAKGVVLARLPKGNYTITASKIGYFADSVTYSLTRDMQDTLQIRLRPEPKPIAYTLSGRVFTSETHQPLEAEVQIISTTNGTSYTGTTADDGLFVTNLLAGRYMANIRCPGYMPLDDSVSFTKDTLSFYMTKIKQGLKVKINNLYFATNRTYILPQSESALQDLTQFLLDNQSVRIRIIGHTDNIGSEKNNQILSEGRANSLRTELIKRGIDADRIQAEGRGESEPIDTNNTEEGRQNNRRVEFMIVSAGDADIQQIH